ncbi:hypothetical protein [Bradyrhizobium sp. RP6]|uniref:hypothetical protein n=1 Tax=Bradyrhizobium sp. RP6 TaxID=2489596 RepID=UPI000F5337F2|nr:hypothetical protein [Bradyrhizobium sp. RP6]RQH16356.1 hypothetical protein EHH60_04050 [Bradyrhizobium sp. RP6]
MCASTCSTCSRSIRSGYVRHVRTQRRYCDYDCYRRGELVTLLTHWSVPGHNGPASGNVEVAARNAIEMFTVLGAVLCWSCTMHAFAFARILTGAYSDGRDPTTMEGGDT